MSARSRHLSWICALLLCCGSVFGQVATFGGRFFFAGEPQPAPAESHITRLESIAYVVGYDETRKSPAWGAYRLQGERKFGILTRPTRFTIDERTQARVAEGDYASSGYDRGHVVPNLAIASRFGSEAQAETFRMSNVMPQKPALNQGPWRLLEDALVNVVAPKDGVIWVIAGPIYEGRVVTMGRKKIPVPTACFMLIADETPSGPRLQAFIMLQATPRGAKFRDFITTVDEVERRTGLDFFRDLPDVLEASLESAKTYWLDN